MIFEGLLRVCLASSHFISPHEFPGPPAYPEQLALAHHVLSDLRTDATVVADARGAGAKGWEFQDPQMDPYLVGGDWNMNGL